MLTFHGQSAQRVPLALTAAESGEGTGKERIANLTEVCGAHLTDHTEVNRSAVPGFLAGLWRGGRRSRHDTPRPPLASPNFRECSLCAFIFILRLLDDPGWHASEDRRTCPASGKAWHVLVQVRDKPITRSIVPGQLPLSSRIAGSVCMHAVLTLRSKSGQPVEDGMLLILWLLSLLPRVCFCGGRSQQYRRGCIEDSPADV